MATPAGVGAAARVSREHKGTKVVSASNWMVCPRCLARAVSEHSDKTREVTESYGKASIEQFDKDRVDLGESPTVKTFSSELREDYEVGITGTGEFFVKYSGSCQVCRFGHTFEHSEQLTIAAETEED